MIPEIYTISQNYLYLVVDEQSNDGMYFSVGRTRPVHETVAEYFASYHNLEKYVVAHCMVSSINSYALKLTIGIAVN